MKYPPITYSLLKKKKACKKQLDLFEKHIGRIEPMPLTKKTIEKFRQLFDLDWAAENLLDSEDLHEYKKARTTAYAEFEKAWSDASAEYNKVIAPVRTEYNKTLALSGDEYVIAAAHDKFNKATDPTAHANVKYLKATASANVKYYKATATEFVRIYKRGL
jgi:hypothetical protein